MVLKGALIGLEENGGFMYGKLNRSERWNNDYRLNIGYVGIQQPNIVTTIIYTSKNDSIQIQIYMSYRQIAEEIVKVC